MLYVSPISGNILLTNFQIIGLDENVNYTVDWGDGNITAESFHIYNKSGIYNINISTDCLLVSSFSLTANDIFLKKQIFWEEPTQSAVGCYNNFNFRLFSDEPITIVNFFNENSSSIDGLINNSFWSHMIPEWSFYSETNEKITSLNIEGEPVVYDNIVVGYSALSSVLFKDDLPGDRIIHATIPVKEENIPYNSNVTDSMNITLTFFNPTYLKITQDGLLPLNSFYWTNQENPFTITVHNSFCENIMHNISCVGIDVKFLTDCYGIDRQKYIISPENNLTLLCQTSNINMSSFFIPTSALNVKLKNDNFLSVECGKNPFENSYIYTQDNYPRNVTISVSGLYTNGDTLFSLTGESTPFDIYPFQNNKEFFRFGEEQTLYDIVERYNHINLDNFPNFQKYLQAIMDDRFSFGGIPDNIKNFYKDYGDIDFSIISNIYDVAQMFDVEFQEFGINYPSEVLKYMHFLSIPLSKLIGYIDLDKYEVGELLINSSKIAENEIIIYKNKGDDYWTKITSNSETDLLTLRNENDLLNDNFCFYRINNTNDNTPIDSYINYQNKNNRLNPQLTTQEDWYSEKGIANEIFNCILTDKLLNIENENSS